MPLTSVGPVEGSPVAVRVNAVFGSVPPLTVFTRPSCAAIKGVNALAIVQVMVLPASAEVIVNRFDKGAEIGLDQIQRSLGGVRIRTVANSFREVSNSINHGDAIGKSARNNPVARQLAELAQALSPHQEGSRSLLGRFFKRA